MKSIIIEIDTDSKYYKLAEKTARKLAMTLRSKAVVSVINVDTSDNHKMYVL